MELPKTTAIVGMPAADSRVRSRKMRAAGDEDLLLGGQVGAAGLDEADHGQPVGEGDLVGAQRLLQRPRVAGAAAHRRVVGGDQALDALDHADAGDDATRRPGTRCPRRRAATAPGTGVSGSSSSSMRSRASSLPRSRCRSTYFSPPPASALACSASELGRAWRAWPRGGRVYSAPAVSRRGREDGHSSSLRDVEVAGAQPLADGLGLRVEAGLGGDALAEQPVDDEVERAQVRQLVPGDGQRRRSPGSSSRSRSTVRVWASQRQAASVAGPHADVGVAALVAAAGAGDQRRAARDGSGPAGSGVGQRRVRRRSSSPARRAGGCDRDAGCRPGDGDVRHGVLRRRTPASKTPYGRRLARAAR